MQGVAYHPDQHDILLFFVIPEFETGTKGSKRRRRRKSFSKVDRLFVQIRSPTSKIKFLGMYPVSRTESDPFDFGIASFVPIAGKLRARGRVRDAIKRGKHLIIANRTDEIAQWIFLKPYVQRRNDFGMKLLCLVPKDLGVEHRFLGCNVSAQDHGREIESAYGRKIAFPMLVI